jgi:hypothetical protein
MRPSLRLALALTLLGSAGLVAHAQPDQATADREVAALSAKVEGFAAITLPATGELALKPGQSLTVEKLRRVTLDDDPPELGALSEPYEESQTDDCAPAEPPYIAQGIEPFRFRYFHCEFNYGGWHNMTMHEYAATHGFDIIFPYVRTLAQRSRMPAGTKWLRWSGFVDWGRWMPEHGIDSARYDLLADRDLVAELVEERFLGDDDPANWDYLMIDMEHSVLPPDALRQREWYPRDASEAERQAFEQRYYHGYALTYSAPMAAAKRLGYRNLSVYGWEPFLRQWWGMDKLNFSPETYWQWAAYGKEIYADPATDILNPSLYVYYWSPQNVASTICNLDYTRALVETMPEQKPIRPYYWTLLHGGGAEYRWWTSQPVTTEEARAWTLLCLMSGTDGFDLWNWSGTGSHQRPRPFSYVENGETKFNDIAVGEAFTCHAEGAAPGAEMAFARYDFIHVVGYDEATGEVRFQRIDRDNFGADYGMTPDQPVYAMAAAELTPHLRAEAEPVAGVIEGMALAKPLEYILSHGEVRMDESSLTQFLEATPIVRRVQLGDLHVVATYDPKVVHGEAPRDIVLRDFAGHAGLTVTLPADAETRVFVLREG